MKQIIVHIGAPKTGTTAIQHALTDARKSLRSAGVIYPRGLSTRSSHNEILDVVIRKPSKWGRSIRLLYSENDSKNLVKTKGSEFIDELKRAKRVVLSAETFFSYMPDEIEKFFDLCNECGFQQPLVVAYLREPARLYVSLVQTILRGRAEFINPAEFRVSYCRILRQWTERDNVQLKAVSYDSGIDVVSHFGQLINEHMNTQAGDRLRSRPNSNRSVSAEAMIFLQDYQKRLRAPGEDKLSFEVNKLIGVFSKLSMSGLQQTKPKARPWVTKMITENNRDEIETLRADFGVSLPPPPPVIADTEPSNIDESSLDVRDILYDWSPDVLDDLKIYSLHELASDAVTKPKAQSSWAGRTLSKFLSK